jgi:hypothetical protein
MADSFVPCVCPLCCGKKVSRHTRRKHSQVLRNGTHHSDPDISSSAGSALKKFKLEAYEVSALIN